MVLDNATCTRCGKTITADDGDSVHWDVINADGGEVSCSECLASDEVCGTGQEADEYETLMRLDPDNARFEVPAPIVGRRDSAQVRRRDSGTRPGDQLC
ncbi:MAG TPA: hypothetical protein VFE65_19345 [Pseudonocardia sp.]|nr:hypothetical protein [Pseudonocardia sp.]